VQLFISLNGVRIPAGLGTFLFDIASRPALWPIQPHIQWVLGALSLRVKRTGHEGDHSPPSSAEVKECVELYLPCPSTPWCGAYWSTGTTLPFIYMYMRAGVCVNLYMENNVYVHILIHG